MQCPPSKMALAAFAGLAAAAASVTNDPWANPAHRFSWQRKSYRAPDLNKGREIERRVRQLADGKLAFNHKVREGYKWA